MDALEALKTRRSIRAYKKKKMPKNVLAGIIDCARLAPTANNRQPWEFIVVTGKETRKKIADMTTYGKFIANAAACVVVCGKKDADYIREDCSAATENILLAAKALGIGSCWVAGYQKAFEDELKGMLGIPGSIAVFSLVALGYPDEQPEPHNKRSVEEVLHWEKF